MTEIHPISPPFSLDAIAKRIRQSSNFRFDWQFYSFSHLDRHSPADALNATNYIIDTPACHAFLRDSFKPMYDESFSIERIHKHATFAPANDQLTNVLAAAANDTLGAYSRNLRNASTQDRLNVSQLFSATGDFCAFQLQPGNVKGCSGCKQHNSHLFSTWFYGVAWDWCFVVTWPQAKHLWLGCLTDTD